MQIDEIIDQKIDRVKLVKNDQQIWLCNKCKDTGRLQDSVAHPAIDLPFKAFCSCDLGRKMFSSWKKEPKQSEQIKRYKTERIENLLKKSGVGKRFKEKSISIFKEQVDYARLYEVLNNYVESWKHMKSEGWGFYFWGKVGSGKTHAAIGLANELIKRKYTEVMFFNLAKAASRVKDGFQDKTKDARLFQDMEKVELLVIDDFGVENSSAWLSEQVYLLINYRYENKLPIIATSNQSLEDLSRMYSPQIASRLREMCQTIQFNQEDQRNKNRPNFLNPNN